MKRLLQVMLFSFVAMSGALAQTPAEFWQGKQVRIVVGFQAGGSSGIYAEALGRHMGRYLPGNPTFINQYMPGGGGLIAANHIASRAAKDGSEIAITSRTAAVEPLLGNPQAKFDGRQFNWIGSANIENSICVANSSTGIAAFADVKQRELIVGGSGADAIDVIMPRAANTLMGSKFKIVPGYNTSNDVLLAMERGEVSGFCGVGWTLIKLRKPELLTQKKINILFQMALKKHEDLPNVPLIQDLASNDDDRRVLEFMLAPQDMGRPFFAPAGVPEDRVKALRDAFAATLKDPQFLKEAEKSGLEIQLVTGQDIHALLEKTYATAPNLIERAKALVAQK